MIRFNRFAFVLFLLAAGVVCAQTNTVTSTTLSAAAGAVDSTITVASATGITSDPPILLFVDREAMRVKSVSGTTITVSRGTDSTYKTAHASGATVWIGQPNWFVSTDPSGACTLTSLYFHPYVNVRNGYVWSCTSGQWTATAFPALFTLSDGSIFISPRNCHMTAATTAWDTGLSPALVRAAANNLVLAATTDTTGGTVTVTCNIDVPSRLTSGKGISITSVDLLYGVQTTELSSIAAADIKSVTYATSTAAGAAAAGTVSAALGGSLTVTPTALQKTATTSGQCFHEKIALGTPIAMNTDSRALTIEQAFTTAGTTKTTLQVCGAMVHYTNVPL